MALCWFSSAEAIGGSSFRLIELCWHGDSEDSDCRR